MWERVAMATIADHPVAGDPAESEFGGALPPIFGRHPGDEEEEDEALDDDDRR